VITDSVTIVWKELKEIWSQGGNRRSGKFGMLVFVGVFGVFLPLQIGKEWVTTPAGLVYWAWVPLFMVTSVIADSFAGERERHTLETLLASRLSDRAILFGKVAAGVTYGWGISLLGILVGVITINVTNPGEGFLIYPLEVILPAVVGGFLIAVLAAAAGVLVSLRASTVRQAAQTMSIATMILFFVPIFGFQLLPADTQRQLIMSLSGLEANLPLIVAGGLVVLLVADAALLLAAMARFQRAKLILD
jgi:ABC-2 type transport system permease protein